MVRDRDAVITGLGVVSPIGIGRETFWASLCEGRSGVHRLPIYDDPDLCAPFGGEVSDFDPKQYVRPRKSLKIMSRDIQLAFAAADLAVIESGVREVALDPERMGVLLGAEIIPCDLDELVATYRSCMVDGRFDFDRWGQAFPADLFPLWMLKYLPNMPACHIGIAQDARGPNNTITLGEVSMLSAMCESIRVLDRGQADVMITGGVGMKIHPAFWARHHEFGHSRRQDAPEAASRPFDASRDGVVSSEAAGAFVLETEAMAQARNAAVLAHVLGYAETFEPQPIAGKPCRGDAIRRAIGGAMKTAGLQPDEVGFVAAHGVSSVEGDRAEAHAIRDILGNVPVTAPKSYYGHPGAASGALETAVCLLALQHGQVPPTLNYEQPDPQCPVNVVHGAPQPLRQPTAMVLSYSDNGQAVAVILGGPSA